MSIFILSICRLFAVPLAVKWGDKKYRFWSKNLVFEKVPFFKKFQGANYSEEIFQYKIPVPVQ